MFRFSILLSVLTLLISGCSINQAKSLSSPTGKPIIGLGEKSIPKNDDYILHIKSGERIPMIIEIHGDVFTNAVRVKSYVTAKQAMYLAKHQVSYNGKDWFPVKRLLAMRLSAKLDANGSELKIQINKRGN